MDGLNWQSLPQNQGYSKLPLVIHGKAESQPGRIDMVYYGYFYQLIDFV